MATPLRREPQAPDEQERFDPRPEERPLFAAVGRSWRICRGVALKLLSAGARVVERRFTSLDDSMPGRGLIWISDRWRVIRPVWLPVVVAAMVWFLLVVVGQGDELVRAIVEDLPNTWSQALGLIGGATGLGLSLWYTARALLYVDYGLFESLDRARRTGWPERFTGLRGRLPWLLGLVPPAAVLVAVARHSIGLAALLLVVAAAMIGWMRRIRARGRYAERRRALVERPTPDLPPQTFWTLLEVFVAFGIVTLLMMALPTDLRLVIIEAVGTAGIVMLALAMWVLVLSVVLVYPSVKHRLFPPLLAWVVLAGVGAGAFWGEDDVLPLQFNHGPAFDRWEARPDLAGRIAGWLQHAPTASEPTPPTLRPPLRQPRPLIVVAAEGGGIRAAYWTAAVLARIVDTVPGAERSLFAVSGVSGGSVGAAVVAGLLAEKRRLAGSSSTEPSKLTPYVGEILGRDLLSPAVAGLVTTEPLRRFLPLDALPSRQVLLEQGFVRAWRKALSCAENEPCDRMTRPLTELGASGAAPLLLLNTTEVNRGERAVVSDMRLDPVTQPGRPGAPSPFRGARDTLRMLGHDLPLGTAAFLSARFTYISPAAVLQTQNETIRLVDGGYFENTGALTAQELLDGLAAPGGGCRWNAFGRLLCGPEGRQVEVRPLVLLLRNGAVDQPQSPSQGLGGWFTEALPPIETMLATRVARSESAVLTIRAAHMGRTCELGLPAPGAGDGTSAVPLGWMLSRSTQAYIDARADEAVGMFEAAFRRFSQGGETGPCVYR